MQETDVKHLIMLELSRRGHKVFNRPTGLLFAKHGNSYVPVKVNSRGASDLQGHLYPSGRAFYIETKKPGHKTGSSHLAEQENFLEQMRNSGALAGFADSVEAALDILELRE